ncbi:MAG: SDR family NAD(P)-dependent oxidoreductase [Bacteroidetes bacterium]|nr:SDR family NAD(P)-dependent oxidoreductase [Bacteroidota bacterium]
MKTGQQVWLITGVSGGLGRALAAAVAKEGHIAVGTLRKAEQVAEYEAICPGFTRGIVLDVNQHDAVRQEVQKLLSAYGSVDVLVNNAGYGLFGAIEETDMDEARAQMETNFFGALAMCQALIPTMRERRSGCIIQISSIAGFRGTNGLGIYNASKFALEGMSEAMAQELQPFGIRVILVEPGPFRTAWAGSSSVRTRRVMAEYQETAGVRIAQIQGYNGQQPGDPDKAARVIMEAAASANPPLHLPLGPLAIEGFRVKMKQLEAEISSWESRAADTSYDH